MSTTNLRIVAAAITLIMAVLVGILTGVAGGISVAASSCGSSQNPNQPPSDEKPGNTSPSPGGESAQPGNGTTDQGTTGQGTTGQGTTGQGTTDQGNTDQGSATGGAGQPGNGPGNSTSGLNQSTGNGIPNGSITAQTCSDVSFSLLAAVIGFLGTLVTGLACLLVMSAGRRTAPAAPGGRAGPPVGVLAPPVSAPPANAGDRDQLVETLIYVRDRATSNALADRILRDLQTAGVSELRPAGEKFDPSRHEAGGSTETADAELDGRIAGVETPGYLDHGRVLRLPVVTVYRRNT
jgi:hypothetical protein